GAEDRSSRSFQRRYATPLQGTARHWEVTDGVLIVDNGADRIESMTRSPYAPGRRSGPRECVVSASTMRFDGVHRGHHRNALSGIGTHLKACQCGIRRHRARARAEPTGREWAAAVTFAEVARARYRREYEADAHRARPDPLGAGLPGRHQPADALEDRECSDLGEPRDGG